MGALDRLSDGALVGRAQQGDTVAFEVLIGRHQQRAYAVAVRVMGDRSEAEDAVQDALVTAWRRLGGFRREAAFSTWLHRVVVNACLDALRRRPQHDELDDARPVQVPAHESPEQRAEQHDALEAIRAALRRMPAPLRAVWVLREVEGCSYEEVADILGTSTSTVRGRLHRARVTLARDLEEWR